MPVEVENVAKQTIEVEALEDIDDVARAGEIKSVWTSMVEGQVMMIVKTGHRVRYYDEWEALFKPLTSNEHINHVNYAVAIDEPSEEDRPPAADPGPLEMWETIEEDEEEAMADYDRLSSQTKPSRPPARGGAVVGQIIVSNLTTVISLHYDALENGTYDIVARE